MEKLLSIAQLESRYLAEWVLLIDPATDDKLSVLRGRVAHHSKDRDEVYRRAVEPRPKKFAVLYTGRLPEHTAIAL
ncbi:MAG: hypothetical protein HZA54_00980 [Planctomycetes bacterium]|nr:hypothetical protein [Planctomycetota bacterium]